MMSTIITCIVLGSLVFKEYEIMTGLAFTLNNSKIQTLLIFVVERKTYPDTFIITVVN